MSKVMATDLETGEHGSAFELFCRAIERRERRWREHVSDGLARVNLWRREHPGRKVTPTRFYRLLHGDPS